jgi:hypothetical protein
MFTIKQDQHATELTLERLDANTIGLLANNIVVMKFAGSKYYLTTGHKIKGFEYYNNKIAKGEGL